MNRGDGACGCQVLTRMNRRRIIFPLGPTSNKANPNRNTSSRWVAVFAFYFPLKALSDHFSLLVVI